MSIFKELQEWGRGKIRDFKENRRENDPQRKRIRISLQEWNNQLEKYRDQLPLSVRVELDSGETFVTMRRIQGKGMLAKMMVPREPDDAVQINIPAGYVKEGQIVLIGNPKSCINPTSDESLRGLYESLLAQGVSFKPNVLSYPYEIRRALLDIMPDSYDASQWKPERFGFELLFQSEGKYYLGIADDSGEYFRQVSPSDGNFAVDLAHPMFIGAAQAGAEYEDFLEWGVVHVLAGGSSERGGKRVSRFVLVPAAVRT